MERKRQPQKGTQNHDTPPDTLAALLRRYQDNTGSSYADIAKRAGLSKAKIGQIANPDSHFQLRPDTIEKLAHAIGLPLPVVRRAALVTAGVADHQDPRTARIELVVHQLEQLDDDTFGLFEAMLTAAVRHRSG